VTPRILNGLWCLAIIYSTLATKQHVALDAAAGAVLGLVVAVPHLYLLRGWRGLRREFESG
jgi:membrane-associated phospholipid phosphatase